MIKTLFLLLIILTALHLSAQDGTLLNKSIFTFPDSVWTKIKNIDPAVIARIKDSIDFFRITYLSDGLKVTGYVAEPKAQGIYPCIISNRGGNREFGMWNPVSITLFLGQMATWNYVVIASQYRGNDGGEGIEEFGGKEVDDIFNLIPVLAKDTKADTSRIGMEGTSRGGMMTYLSLKRSCRFKAAVVTSGMADAFLNTAARPEMDQGVFAELAPGYATHKDEVLKSRSAVYWADQMCRSTPLLIMHGSSDWRVLPEESLELVQKLYEAKHPVRYIFFEGADHGIHEFWGERFDQTRRHFDYYLRDGKKWPSMEKHGK
ncbi:MAG TPA: prolyl oligopeptidase family serine peptidase [Saprospiraceae bacterium]|nr:prolyl oligopeptidase family serine peptidase [Saprospiraceae bacterium]